LSDKYSFTVVRKGGGKETGLEKNFQSKSLRKSRDGSQKWGETVAAQD